MGQKESHSGIPDEEVDEIKDVTDFSGREIREFYEQYHEQFPEGTISRGDFIAKYREMLPNVNVDGFASHIFDAYDQDGDNTIDFKEFMITMHATTRGTVEDKLDWAFNLYDKNGDGVISRKEVTSVLASIFRMKGVKKPVKEAEDAAFEIFVNLDKNQNNSITKEEFIHGAKKTDMLGAIMAALSDDE